ncbi:MAG: DUF11 domain-containing protein [Clostridium sp.]|uniref:hypothetical protein n=1 Tax=Clostridium sp. TaxID=1506 RepID=UPI0025BFDC7F|nr:hypothetical protein [Clostridium sp.]MCF0146794.1 DUF11 domain-containing protein [Clostridium sp.]
MAIMQRFSAVDKAVLISTGNSLVVCGSSTEPFVNTSDLIKVDGTVTRDWTQAGSSANLNILANSTILYAELLWYSTVFSNVTGTLDLRSIQDNPITLTTSKGSYQITPDNTDTYVGASGSIDRYRSANVTNYVKDAMAGNYTVSNVPISIPATGLSNSRAGWSLTVIYRNNLLRPQKVIYSSGVIGATANAPLQATISGFTTSSDPNFLNGSITIVAANGTPLNGNEVFSIGPSFAQLSNVGNPVYTPNPNPGTAPNNPGNSFFSAAINVADPLNNSNGLLNINGTNGVNNNDGFVPIQKIGARNKWDITNVNISNTLVTNQTLVAGQLTTAGTGDGIQLVVVGSQVSAKAPNIIATLEAYDIDNDSEYNVEVGEPQVYAIKIRNDGDEDANNVIVSAVLNSSSSFIPGSVTINGVSNQSANIINGINVGTISARGVTTVLFNARIDSVPSGGTLYQNVNYSYQFPSGIDIITNNGTTNTIALIVQEGRVKLTKVASKTALAVGDTVTYTIDIQNVGTEIAQNIFFQDKLDVNSSFVPETVLVNGVQYSDYNPVAGFNLPNMAVGAINEIVFQAKVNSIPSSTKVNNIAFVTFGYMYNQVDYLRTKTIASNSVSITVQFIDIIGERCNNNNYPSVGDTVTYTLRLTNMGNIPANNVAILEAAIPGATFVSGSVKINGVSYPNLNPFTGFNLPSAINPQETANVEYKVLINSINPGTSILNTAQVPFRYQIIPGGTVIDSEQTSNTVETVANFVCINAVKSVNTSYAEIGNTLYYKVEVTNGGNINATDTVFLDSLQSYISFVPGTVAINGVLYPNYDPTIGFSLGTICPDDAIDVTFQAIVNSRPQGNIVYNNASIVYQFKPDPNRGKLTNTVLTNTVQTTINEAKYTVIKSVDKTYAQVNDFLVYTTTIQNLGNVNLTNIKFADYIGTVLEFYEGTVYINGINYPNYNPSNQFEVPDMHPGDTTTVVFGVKILDFTPVGYIPNMSEVTVTFKQSPDSPVITRTVYSNDVRTYIPVAKIDLIKSVDKSYAGVGDILTYSFTATNNGNSTAINTLFTDILQSEISLVSGSVIVNGVSKPNYDPQVGFTLGNMNTGQVVTIEFKVKVNSLPNPNTVNDSAIVSYSYYVNPADQPITRTSNSNTVTTIINSYSANLTKAVNRAYATIGDTLNYTITVNNTGTVTLSNVNFKDIIPSGATFVNGSVVIDGVSKPTYNPNTGFLMNDVLPGGYSVVVFNATVTSVPTPPQINNTANITFKYQLSPTSSYIDGTLTSNTVTTNITTVNVTNTKSVNKAYATINDTLTYTSVIANTGNVNIENTNFIDNLRSEISFVPGSVKIDGVTFGSYDPTVGFTLGTINPSSTKTVTFDVVVTTLPQDNVITNSSILNYQYKLDPTKPYINGTATSNTVTTVINYGDLTITKASDRSSVRLSNVITYNFVVTNTGNTILQNLLFKDIIQAESSFNAGSVFINGVNRSNYNPNTGFPLDNINIGGRTTISFTVTANSIPANNQLLNSSDINYSYYVDPQGQPINKTKTSNTTTVYVYDTIVSANKIVDKAIAKLGDTLNFIVTLKNDGNVPTQHGFFKDILDSNISFVSNSVYVNGAQKTGFNPSTGFNIDDILAGTTTTITFAATIISRPANNIIYNFATYNYDYLSGTETISATINTNTTQTYVAFGELTITKSVDKAYATVGDTLAYSVLIRNTGSVNATNLIFKDLIQSSASFITGSVVVDGVSEPSFNPNTGFNLSDLPPYTSHIVIFNVKVDSLPQSGEINNSSDVTFTYKLTDSDQPVTRTTTSNTVTTLIKIATLTATKAVDKAYATIGDTLNYTVTINNSGNANAFNVFFQDIIQANASFIAGSVKINGVTYDNYNPNTGFVLADIIGFGSITVTFAVRVQSLPVDHTIYNFATISYKYYIDPSNSPIARSVQSNTVQTVINVGSLQVNKAVSKSYATINDVITYTVTIFNAGNTLAKNVNFRDVIPFGLTFVTGSVKVNNISYPALDPYASFTLGNIISGDTVIVTFDALVTSLPNPSLVSNTANITFSYKIDPNGADITVIVNSNTVTTQINVGSLNLVKSVNKAYATMGDIITYTVVVSNNGNVIADNVVFTDNLQQDILFNLGSVKVNGITYPNYDPNVGFNIGNIDTLNSVTVVFTATVINNPTSRAALNYAIGTFSYKVDPSGQYYEKSIQSNTVSTILVRPALSARKIVDKAYATILDELNYSVQVKNDGTTTISRLFFTDFLSNGAAFKSGTVKVDGLSYPSYDPISGFNLPDLVSGNTSLVEFKAIINTLPTPPQITNYAISNGVYYVDPQGSSYPISATSNTVTTNVNVGTLSNVKTVDKMYAKVNDIVSYTSTITNTGNVNATNIFFTDILAAGLIYAIGTVSINGIIYPSLDPVTGFQLSDLAPNQTVVVSFNAKVTSLPTPSYISNTSNVQFSYKVDPNGNIITKDQPSNTVITNIVLGKITAVKVVDKPIATIGDDLVYTITLTNNGNVIDNNVVFQDVPSTGAVFKANSVKVNNISQPTFDPTVGFNLGSIGIGNVVTVQFTATVVSVPPTNQVTNKAFITFDYLVDPKQPPYTDTTYSNTVTTNIALGKLTVTKEANKKFATIGEEITYTIVIQNTGNINATNVIFIDPIPHNTIFVNGSVTINGVAYPNYNPAVGFDLNTMTPGQIITVVYRVQIINLC